MMAIFSAVLPRFLLLVGWANDQAFWTSVLGAPVWFLGGFLFFPWTTFVYGYVSPNGMTLLNWVFLLCAFLIDLSTWGIGVLAARKETQSNFRAV